jgi:hypothetical protein
MKKLILGLVTVVMLSIGLSASAYTTCTQSCTRKDYKTGQCAEWTETCY